MLTPVVLSAPAAATALVILAAALMAYRRWTDAPIRLTLVAPAPKAPRHRLADATTPYRPHAWTDTPRVALRPDTTWSPDDLDAALDAAEKVAAEMAATERAWAAENTRELVAA